ncbi:MAG: glycine--tRNA ligase [Desulfurococcales archaeon]|jgi:glycyl-tRNA synthetase|nr:glycine--tRNA ligase [Desulfurococcales archaeon]
MMGDRYEKIVDLAVRRGFFWPSYEIYGGVSGLYDLGPLGFLLKRNIVEEWRRIFVQRHQEYVVEIETPVIAPSKVFEASGHVESFTDPIVECSKCGRKYRADHLIESIASIKTEGLRLEDLTKIIREKDIRCPQCGGPLGDVKLFNLLFRTTIGPYTDSIGYLRPEAAQGMFTAFKRVYETMRERLPLGIAQIGRVARNEISPRQGMIRLREFTIMEIEFFHDPKNPSCPLLDRVRDSKLRILTASERESGEQEPTEYRVEELVREGVVRNEWHVYWMAVASEFIESLGVPPSDTYFEEKLSHERAHYASQVFDQLVRVSRWGWIEVSGHANRTDFDLSRHSLFSGADLTVYKRYDKPIPVRKRKIRLDKQAVLRLYGERAPEVFKALSRVDLERLDLSREEIDVGGIKVSREVFRVEDIEELVHGEKFYPHVIEPSFGAERLVYVVLDRSYSEEDGRVILKIPPRLAPIVAGIYPLISEEKIVKIARRIYEDFIRAGFYVLYDESGSIGRRYARADEIGVPLGITIDGETLENNTVTIRFRDTREQIRIKIEDLIEWVRSYLEPKK